MPESTATLSALDPAGGVVDTGEPPVLELRGISKRFAAISALSGVNLTVGRGEVHALFGHNGAGKSTLIKTLAGAETPDEGQVIVNGARIDVSNPRGALDAGIRVVYQELSLFGSLTVAENLVGNRDSGSFVDRARMMREAKEHLATMGLEIDPAITVEQLPLGEQQMIEIGRALFSGGRIIVLDEPTSALSPGETRLLFRLVGEMARQGITFILISHFLDEILDNADRVTVMRSGTVLTTLDVAGTTAPELIALALGDDSGVLAGTYSDVASVLPPPKPGPIVLSAQNLSVGSAVSRVTFDLAQGEILAVYGELGCGNETVGEAVFGLSHPTGGTLTVLGHTIGRQSPDELRRIGVGYIPADRRAALALEQPIYRNMTLAALRKVSPGILRIAKEKTVASGLIDRLGIRGATPALPVGNLSGGNQQKALIARWLVDLPEVLVLGEPTRGMDVGAKSDVLRTIESIREQGVSVLLITSEPETALATADRILTMSRGVITQQFAGTSVTARDLVEAVS
jgi:ribose transport system ATP-binding protein